MLFGSWILDEEDLILIHLITRYEVPLKYVFDSDRWINHIAEKRWADEATVFNLRRAINYATREGLLGRAAIREIQGG